MDPSDQTLPLSIIKDSIIRSAAVSPDLLADRAIIILEDTILLARCAKSKCLISYSDAISLRGHGNPQNGQWLDDLFAHAILPLGFPDLTMLVVNKNTNRPSPDIFKARRSELSKIRIDDVPMEQNRCIWFKKYEVILGPLEEIPRDKHAARRPMPQGNKEREISRCVSNAMLRISNSGKFLGRNGKDYPLSLSRSELMSLVEELWRKQNGCCALTGVPFETRKISDGGIQDDRVSIDRIENHIGYSYDNVQLTTQFANRARGSLSVSEAKKRLVQK